MRYLIIMIAMGLVACGQAPQITIGPQGPQGEPGNAGATGATGTSGTSGGAGLTSGAENFCTKNDSNFGTAGFGFSNVIYSYESVAFSSGDLFVSCSVNLDPTYSVYTSFFYKAGQSGSATGVCTVKVPNGNNATWTFAYVPGFGQYVVTYSNVGSALNGYSYRFTNGVSGDCQAL